MDWVDIEDGESGLSVRNKLNDLGRLATSVFGGPVILFKLNDANLNSISAQVFEKTFDFSKYIITQAIAFGPSADGTGAVGATYMGPSKTLPIWATSVNFSTLNSSNRVQMIPLQTSNVLIYTSTIPYLELTTASTNPCTADIYLMGIALE